VSPRRWLALGGLLLVSYAWFYPAGGWNQNSRFDLIRALTEQGTIRIDAYASNTGDKALSGGHVYSDKAPGQAFLAAPFVLAARPFVHSAVGVSYVATLATSALPAAATGVLLVWIALRLGASVAASMFGALVWALGSPAFAYATLLWGHSLAACALLAAFACAVALDPTVTPRRAWVLGAGLGLAAGWAVVTEYQAAPPALLLAGLALTRVRGGGRGRLARVAAGIAAGALPCAALLGVYDAAAFGSPFSTPLAHLAGFARVRDSPFHRPSGAALVAILLGPERGLLPLAPALVAAPLGFARALRVRGERAPWIVAAAIVVYYLLLNAAFRTPMAGWSYGPRYLAAALPFLALGLAPVWAGVGRFGRGLLVATGLAGAALALMAVSTTPQPPEDYERPLAELIWPAFAAGDLSLNPQSFLDLGTEAHVLRGGRLPHRAWNLGEKLGLEGRASLTPLLGLWLGCAWLLRAADRRRTRPPEGSRGGGAT
jgi:hypothetical protein